jgi:hypothetical protein
MGNASKSGRDRHTRLPADLLFEEESRLCREQQPDAKKRSVRRLKRTAQIAEQRSSLRFIAQDFARALHAAAPKE